jgi:hypothetical protein
MGHFLLDYGEEHHLCWVVFQDDTGECWTWSNPEIKLQTNQTMGRPSVSSKSEYYPPNPNPAPQRNQDLPEPVAYSEELRRKIAEKFPTPAFE